MEVKGNLTSNYYQDLHCTKKTDRQLLLYEILRRAYIQHSIQRHKQENFIARMATRWPGWGLGLEFHQFFIQPLFQNPLVMHFLNLSDFISLSQIKIKYGYAENNKGITWVLPKIRIKNSANQERIIEDPDLVDFTIALLEPSRDIKFSCEYENTKPFLVWARGADLAVQAFHSLVKGLLRNAAKHRHNKSQNDQLELRIVIFPSSELLDSSFPRDSRFAYLLLSASTDYSAQKVREEKTLVNIVNFLNNKICQKVIDPLTGEVTPGNWGLKEIKVCAAFLSNAQLKEVDTENPDYIEVRECPEGIWNNCDDKKRFCYIIRLEKSRQLLAILNQNVINNILDRNKWEVEGIRVIPPDDIINDSDTNYSLLYLDANVNLPETLKLPQKQIKGNLDLQPTHPDKFLLQAYDLHLKDLIKDKKYHMVIYFEDVDRSKKWTQNINNINYQIKIEFPKTVVGINEILNNKYLKILLLRHHNILGQLQSMDRTKLQLYFYQFASYSDPFFNFLFHIDPERLGGLIIRQFVESALMNVLVIDERIAQEAVKLKAVEDKNVNLVEKLYWMGIYIARSVKKGDDGNETIWLIDNAESDSNRMVDVEMRYFQHVNNSRFELEKDVPVHILLIHASKLKEIAAMLGKNLEETVRMFKTRIPYVIVHSGRGKTTGDIPDNAPFLDFNIVQQYLTTEPSKFFLVQVALNTKIE
ncbi:MAG: hypothetical protein ABIK48_05835 [candidate division WOR-3 bacterium]